MSVARVCGSDLLFLSCAGVGSQGQVRGQPTCGEPRDSSLHLDPPFRCCWGANSRVHLVIIYVLCCQLWCWISCVGVVQDNLDVIDRLIDDAEAQYRNFCGGGTRLGVERQSRAVRGLAGAMAWCRGWQPQEQQCTPSHPNLIWFPGNPNPSAPHFLRRIQPRPAVCSLCAIWVMCDGLLNYCDLLFMGYLNRWTILNARILGKCTRLYRFLQNSFIVMWTAGS